MKEIEVGGIYRTGAALVLVTKVDEEVSVTLLSPDIELGTSNDLVLTPEDSGLAYALLVEADVFGYVAAERLGPRLGRVPYQVFEALSALRNDDAADWMVAGPPALTPRDPRWGFKLAELSRLRRSENSNPNPSPDRSR